MIISQSPQTLNAGTLWSLCDHISAVLTANSQLQDLVAIVVDQASSIDPSRPPWHSDLALSRLGGDQLDPLRSNQRPFAASATGFPAPCPSPSIQQLDFNKNPFNSTFCGPKMKIKGKKQHQAKHLAISWIVFGCRLRSFELRAGVCQWSQLLPPPHLEPPSLATTPVAEPLGPYKSLVVIATISCKSEKSTGCGCHRRLKPVAK